MFGIEAALTGKLGREPELKHVKGGALALLRLAVAVDEPPPKDGQEIKATWVRVTVFGDLAEAAAESLEKGSRVYCHGRLSLDTWPGPDGAERHGLSMVADLVQRQGVGGQKRQHQPRKASSGKLAAGADAQRPIDRHHRDDGMDQDLPF